MIEKTKVLAPPKKTHGYEYCNCTYTYIYIHIHIHRHIHIHIFTSIKNRERERNRLKLKSVFNHLLGCACQQVSGEEAAYLCMCIYADVHTDLSCAHRSIYPPIHPSIYLILSYPIQPNPIKSNPSSHIHRSIYLPIYPYILYHLYLHMHI